MSGQLVIARTNPRNAAEPAEELARLWPLLGRHIAFHRHLVDLTASVKAALLLSQSIYWTRHGRDIVERGGWFFKTSEQWERETGLSACEQAGARRILRGLAILGEQRFGVPARLHYRLALEPIAAWVFQGNGSDARIDWDDAAAVARLLGPTLAYHRRLAAVAGGVHAGLLLSRALYLMRHDAQRHSGEWLRRSVAEWTAELGLTRHEQEAARGLLARAGIWEEMIAGMPARLITRVRLDELLVRLGDTAPGRMPASFGHPECGASACREPSLRDPQDREASMRESHILVSTKPATKFRQNRQACFDKSGTPYIESTQRLLQPPHEPSGQCEPHPPGGGDLILPEQILPEEREVALDLVARCPDKAQALLDELAARLEAGAVRTSPIAYLRGMVRRAEAGSFIPEAGLRIAAARQARSEQARRREREQAEAQRLAAERADPDYAAKLAQRIESLRRAMSGTATHRNRSE